MDQIQFILKSILELCDPYMVILYSLKSHTTGDPQSADFCLVIDQCDKTDLMRKLYLNIDSEIPYNLLIYKKSEWDEVTADPDSYASAIKKRGILLYERT